MKQRPLDFEYLVPLKLFYIVLAPCTRYGSKPHEGSSKLLTSKTCSARNQLQKIEDCNDTGQTSGLRYALCFAGVSVAAFVGFDTNT